MTLTCYSSAKSKEVGGDQSKYLLTLGSFSQEGGQTKHDFLWQKFQVLHAFPSPSISSLSPSFHSSFLFSLTCMFGCVSRHTEGRQVRQDKNQSFLRSFKGREAKIYTMLKKAPRAAAF